MGLQNNILSSVLQISWILLYRLRFETVVKSNTVQSNWIRQKGHSNQWQREHSEWATRRESEAQAEKEKHISVRSVTSNKGKKRTRESIEYIRWCAFEYVNIKKRLRRNGWIVAPYRISIRKTIIWKFGSRTHFILLQNSIIQRSFLRFSAIHFC